MSLAAPLQCCLSIELYLCAYSGPFILRLPLKRERYGLKLKAALKWRDIYINMIMVSLVSGLKMDGIVKWGGGLKLQGPLYIVCQKCSPGISGCWCYAENLTERLGQSEMLAL